MKARAAAGEPSAPGRRRETCASSRREHRPPLGELEETLDDAIDQPDVDDAEHDQTEPEREHQHRAQHAPQQTPPEGTDLPVEVALVDRATRVVALDDS